MMCPPGEATLPTPTDSGGTLRAGQFAKLAGVSVRALHHYERLGLLRPQRSDAGYRLYSIRDLEVLEQIVVLRFLGVPLRQIGRLLRASPKQLVDSLRAQRGTLERKRQLIDQAIAAIGSLEAAVASGAPAEARLYKRIIEVIAMQDDSRAWTQQYDELVSKKIERLRTLSPEALADLRRDWAGLVAQIHEALTEDPGSARAQTLGARWSELLGQLMGQPVATSTLQQHHAHQTWDPRMASFVDEPVWNFMTRVLSAGSRSSTS